MITITNLTDKSLEFLVSRIPASMGSRLFILPPHIKIVVPSCIELTPFAREKDKLKFEEDGKEFKIITRQEIRELREKLWT